MFHELVKTMGFLYTYASRGRGKLTRGQLGQIRDTGGMLVQNAEKVLGENGGISKDERTDLTQAVMMEQHIIEVVQYLVSQEII